MDFHLWGHLKNKAFKIAPPIIDELKVEIAEESNKFDSMMLDNLEPYKMLPGVYSN